ncbi:MAG: LuxR family transcriptional regulator, partial [Vitreimonas sp.]
GEPVRAKIDWDFAEFCDKATTVSEVSNALIQGVRSLGFTHVACASHVDPLKPPQGAVMIVDYPKGWIEHYSDNNFAPHDPVFNAARNQALPFQWNDEAFLANLDDVQLDMLAQAADVGLRNGLTIPIHVPGALPASCSLAIGPDGIDPLSTLKAHWYAVYSHEAVRRVLSINNPVKRPVLSVRERQCIALIAQGKDDYAVSVILGISEHTAHNIIRRAMGKYGVATRVQAFVRALRDGQIRLEDVAC